MTCFLPLCPKWPQTVIWTWEIDQLPVCKEVWDFSPNNYIALIVDCPPRAWSFSPLKAWSKHSLISCRAAAPAWCPVPEIIDCEKSQLTIALEVMVSLKIDLNCPFKTFMGSFCTLVYKNTWWWREKIEVNPMCFSLFQSALKCSRIVIKLLLSGFAYWLTLVSTALFHGKWKATFRNGDYCTSYLPTAIQPNIFQHSSRFQWGDILFSSRMNHMLAKISIII